MYFNFVFGRNADTFYCQWLFFLNFFSISYGAPRRTAAFLWDVTKRTVTSQKSEYLKNKAVPLQTTAREG